MAGGVIAAGGVVAVSDEWRRFGLIFRGIAASPVTFELTFPGDLSLDIWGLSGGTPQNISEENRFNFSDSNAAEMVPEAFYFPHETALNVEYYPDESTSYMIETGRDVILKKCSYCARVLPIDPNRLGMLAFHKHNAKKTKHQNECRVCKKLRINATFNPQRTADQLHESSVITRERKLFLREPQRLQELKSRLGSGLRSQVWNRFDRKCFRCGVDVSLKGFQLDHTRPLAYLWPIDEYATCLCAGCNNAKKDKFPSEFYTEAELVELSGIIGLSIEELTLKSLNQPELQRIQGDLEGFARAWEPRTFFACARKIREIEPGVDIELLLQQQNPELYTLLLLEYNAGVRGADTSDADEDEIAALELEDEDEDIGD